MKNTANPHDDGVLLFEEIKKYEDVSVTNDFTAAEANYFNGFSIVYFINLLNGL